MLERRYLKHRVLLFILLSLLTTVLFGQTGRYARIQSDFQKGNKKAVKDSLSGFKQYSKDDTSFYNLYMGRLESNFKTAESFFLKVIKAGKRGMFYDEASLEMGKIRFFERHYKEAMNYFKQIKSIDEAHFWLARTYYKSGKNLSKARAEAKVYLNVAKDVEKKKLAYFTVSDAYADEYKYPDAIRVLGQMGDVYPELLKSQSYLLKLGHYNFKTVKPHNSYEYYKQTVELDRFTPYAFEAEKQLYILKNKFKETVDLSCLYPEGDVEPDKKPQVKRPRPKDKPIPKKTTVAKKKDVIEPDLKAKLVSSYDGDLPKKVNKPEKGRYLQLGRFTVERNANKMVVKIRKSKINGCYYISEYQDKDTYVVLAGPFKSGSGASTAKKMLEAMEINSFIKVVND
ncbi:MAG: SPOR domain-containing protein [Candidatus Zophobacter franzmannii]|nr:SPOR domain-containing protein [Candidatus Zophobacter franzmannii]